MTHQVDHHSVQLMLQDHHSVERVHQDHHHLIQQLKTLFQPGDYLNLTFFICSGSDNELTI